LLVLMMPRAAAPDAVPLPRLDGRALHATEQADDARAAAAEAVRLPSYVLAVGTALRVLNGLDVRGVDEVEKIDARRRLEGSVHDLPAREGVEAELLALRAVQVRHFLDAVAKWEATGESTEDLVELGGGFLRNIEDAGWIVHRHVLLDESQRRVAFKVVWNTLIGVDKRQTFALTLDEQRALYTFYIEHPHPPESHRRSLAMDRESAKDPEACARVNADADKSASLWLVEKIKKLGALDPSYPSVYAAGVAYYQAGHFDQSAEAFSAFIGAHPDGAYALRAKNHLKAALKAQDAY
jgi:hypothetical protein